MLLVEEGSIEPKSSSVPEPARNLQLLAEITTAETESVPLAAIDARGAARTAHAPAINPTRAHDRMVLFGYGVRVMTTVSEYAPAAAFWKFAWVIVPAIVSVCAAGPKPLPAPVLVRTSP